MIALLFTVGATMLSPAKAFPVPAPPEAVVRVPLEAVIPEDEYRKVTKNPKFKLGRDRWFF